MNCYTCAFYKDFDGLRSSFGHMGECHGAPPNAMMNGVVNQQAGPESRFVVWPIVKPDEFCAMYQPNDEELQRIKNELWQQAEEEFTKLTFWDKFKMFLDLKFAKDVHVRKLSF